jgi:2'-5' RNA ligase
MDGSFIDADRLFFAAIPDSSVAAQIHRRAGILKCAHKLLGRLIEPERLHVSLFFLGNLPEQSLQMACEAAADVLSTFHSTGPSAFEAGPAIVRSSWSEMRACAN